jgi:hypothetical protein
MPASRSYSVQIQHAGQRRWLGLGTASKKDAAALALKLYLGVRARGWEEVMRQRRGDPASKKVNVTVGEYIEAVAKSKSLLSPKTLESYAQALRKIAGDIVAETKREKRDAIKLRTLSSEKIEAWRIEFIRKKATDPLKEKSARVSVGSFIYGRVHSLAPRWWRGSAISWSFPSRYPLPASRSRRYTCHATGAPSTSWRCWKAPGRNWPLSELRNTRSSSWVP